MYLLNTSTKRLQKFGGSQEVQYAILSHRWSGDEGEEVTFEDIKDLTSCSKSGLSKVTSFCNTALELGYQWCWMDTCCIDKASSAELTEAINSMFRWYRNAAVCIVYLQDVESQDMASKGFETQFRASTWFLRSWTLQELLASPGKISYYNTGWRPLGCGKDLVSLVSDITTIDQAALLGEKELRKYCIAERMSWASMRSATRIEDVAYSLLGIFDVNMPLVYGEGLKAFKRLQQAIMSASDDETIFAWEPITPDDIGLLARSPSMFAKSRNVRPARRQEVDRQTYEMTNRVVKFESADYIPVDSKADLLLLNVIRQKAEQRKYQIGIYVVKNQHQDGHHRVWVPLNEQLKQERLEESAKRPYHRTYNFPFDHNEVVVHEFDPLKGGIELFAKVSRGYDLSILSQISSAKVELTDPNLGPIRRFASDSEKGGPICNINFRPPLHGISVIHLGIDGDERKPVCAILSDIYRLPQSHLRSQEFDDLIRDLTIDYYDVKTVERQLLPDRTNDGKDWHLPIWPAPNSDKTSWYYTKMWQHPKLQPDSNYFCPFPFNPRFEQGNSARLAASYVGWGIELADVGHGKWRFGIVNFSIVSDWGGKVKQSLISKILDARPQSLQSSAYSIDLDTFKSVKKFPQVLLR